MLIDSFENCKLVVVDIVVVVLVVDYMGQVVVESSQVVDTDMAVDTVAETVVAVEIVDFAASMMLVVSTFVDA